MLKIEKYLPKNYFQQIKLQNAVVALVYKQNASKVISSLRNLPTLLEKQTHLKRIRKKQQESQFVDVLLCFQSQQQEKETIIIAIKQYIVNLTTAPIPFNPPNTKQQYLEWTQYWPIVFIQQQIYKQIKHSQQQLIFLDECIKQQANFIVFDDKKQLYFRKQTQFCDQGTIQHPIMKLLQIWPKTQAFKQLLSAYYLTKLKLICKVPICGMCAMALVHSRLERIYFHKIQISDQIGEILCCQKLNHRVRIFLMDNSEQ